MNQCAMFGCHNPIPETSKSGFCNDCLDMLNILGFAPDEQPQETKEVDPARILSFAAEIMHQRGQQYDKPEGERSMGRAVEAFNTVTTNTLRESDGWLLLAILKMVRDQSRITPHYDSLVDGTAYMSLYAESRLTELNQD